MFYLLNKIDSRKKCEAKSERRLHLIPLFPFCLLILIWWLRPPRPAGVAAIKRSVPVAALIKHLLSYSPPAPAQSRSPSINSRRVFIL